MSFTPCCRSRVKDKIGLTRPKLRFKFRMLGLGVGRCPVGAGHDAREGPGMTEERAKKEFRPGKRGVFPDGTFIGADADYFPAFFLAAAAVASNMIGVPIMMEA